MRKSLTEKCKTYLLFAIAMFILTIAMVYKLMNSPLWGDEWTEYYISNLSITSGEMYSQIITTFQPPLYNFIMHFWLKISDSIVWFRLFNVFIGVIGGAFLYKTVELVSNSKAAFISILSLAFCYRYIYCVQECSEYFLMIVSLSIAIWGYVKNEERFSYWSMVAFVLGNVAAIYSQYGSAFVSLPLLFFFFFRRIQKENKKEKIITISTYVFCLIAFAYPLYKYFLQFQLAGNEIAGHTVGLTVKQIMDVLFAQGQIVMWFYNLTAESWRALGSIISIIFLILSVSVLLSKKTKWTTKSIIISLWITYFAHYYLTQLHIYGMLHPNESAGIFSRYSYFYIPLMAVAYPVLFFEIKGKKWNRGFWINYIAGGMGVIILFLSSFSLLNNWKKSKDDIYATIWMNNKGWQYPTYMVGGVAQRGFSYYVSKDDNYHEGYLDNIHTWAYIDYLPNKFWVGWSSWGGDQYNEIVSKARQLGFEIKEFDNGIGGQLSLCEMTQEYEELNLSNINILISDVYLDQDDKVHILCRLSEILMYNPGTFQLSYHISDQNGNMIIWDNTRYTLGGWIQPNDYEMVFDPARLGDNQSYSIHVDLVQEGGIGWALSNGFSMPVIKSDDIPPRE